MSTPGDPHDPSLPTVIGRRDPNFKPDPIFAEAARELRQERDERQVRQEAQQVAR